MNKIVFRMAKKSCFLIVKIEHIQIGIVNYVEFLTSIFLKYIAKKSKTYRKLTMPTNLMPIIKWSYHFKWISQCLGLG